MPDAPLAPPQGINLSKFAPLPTDVPPSDPVQDLMQRAKIAAAHFKATGSFDPAPPAAPQTDPSLVAGPDDIPLEDAIPANAVATPEDVPLDLESTITADPNHPLSKDENALAKDHTFDAADFYAKNRENLTQAEEEKLARVFKLQNETSLRSQGLLGDAWSAAKGVGEGLWGAVKSVPNIVKEWYREAYNPRNGGSIYSPTAWIQGTVSPTEIATVATGAESALYKVAQSIQQGNVAGRNVLIKAGMGVPRTEEEAIRSMSVLADIADKNKDVLEGKGGLSQYVVDAMRERSLELGREATKGTNLSPDDPRLPMAFQVNPEINEIASELNNPLFIVGIGGAGSVGSKLLARGAAKVAGVDAAKAAVAAAPAAARAGVLDVAGEAMLGPIEKALPDWVNNLGTKTPPKLVVTQSGQIIAAAATEEGAKEAAKTFTTKAGEGLLKVADWAEGMRRPAAFSSLNPASIARPFVAGALKSATQYATRAAGNALIAAGESLPVQAAEGIVKGATSGAIHAANPVGSPLQAMFGIPGIAEYLGGDPEKAGRALGGMMGVGAVAGGAGATWQAADLARFKALHKTVEWLNKAPDISVENPMSYGETAGLAKTLDDATRNWVSQRVGDTAKPADAAAAGRFEWLRQQVYKLTGTKVFVAPDAQSFVYAAQKMGIETKATNQGFYSKGENTILLNGSQGVAAGGHEVAHLFNQLMPDDLRTQFDTAIRNTWGDDLLVSRGSNYQRGLGVDPSKLSRDALLESGLDEYRAEHIANVIRSADPQGLPPSLAKGLLNWVAITADKLGAYKPGEAGKSDVYGIGSAPAAEGVVRQQVQDWIDIARNKEFPSPASSRGAAEPGAASGTLTPPPSGLVGEANRLIGETPKRPVEDDARAALKNDYGFSDEDITAMGQDAAEERLDQLAQTGAPTVEERAAKPTNLFSIPAEDVNPPMGTVEERNGKKVLVVQRGPVKMPRPLTEAEQGLKAGDKSPWEAPAPTSSGTEQPSPAKQGVKVEPAKPTKSRAVFGVTPEGNTLLNEVQLGETGGVAPRFPSAHLRRVAQDNGYPAPGKGEKHPWWRQRGYIEAPRDMVDFLRQKSRQTKPEGLTVEPVSGVPPTEPPVLLEAPRRSSAGEDIHAPKPPGTEATLDRTGSSQAPRRAVPNADVALAHAEPKDKPAVELFNKAAEEGRAIQLEYNSVDTSGNPGEQTKGARVDEQTVAYLQEAAGAMAPDTRTWVEKTVVPSGWTDVRGADTGKPHVNAQTFNVSIAVGNAQHLLSLLKRAGMEDRIPSHWEYDKSTGSLTPAGWKSYSTDLRAYLENHGHGYGGNGVLLEKPAGHVGEWQNPTPGYTPKQLEPAVRDFLNATMGQPMPLTARQVGGLAPHQQASAVATQIAKKAGLKIHRPPGASGPGGADLYTNKTTGQTAEFGEPNQLREDLSKKGILLGTKQGFPKVNSELKVEHIRNAVDAGPLGRYNTMFARSGHAVARDTFMRGGAGADQPLSDTTYGSLTRARQMTGRPVLLFRDDITDNGNPGIHIKMAFSGGNRIADVKATFLPDGKTAHVEGSYADPEFRKGGKYEKVKAGHGVYAELATVLQQEGIEYLTGDIVGLGAMGLRGKMFGDPVSAYVSRSDGHGNKHKVGEQFHTTVDALKAMTEDSPEAKKGLDVIKKPPVYSDLTVTAKHYVHPDVKYAIEKQLMVDKAPTKKTAKPATLRATVSMGSNKDIER